MTSIYVILMTHRNPGDAANTFVSIMTGPAYKKLEDAEAKLKQLQEKSKRKYWDVSYVLDEVTLYD